MAQVVVACQMVYEEKVITKHNVAPLQAVGWEGKYVFNLTKYSKYYTSNVVCINGGPLLSCVALYVITVHSILGPQ